MNAAFFQVAPEYRRFINQAGLHTAKAFQQLRGVIWCGHPDRHVIQTSLKSSTAEIPVFIKREHRIRWRDRLASAFQGFGFVSKSLREFQLLQQCLKRKIPCPIPIAAGEDNAGHAFLTVRKNDGAVELRSFLQSQITSLSARRSFAHQFGAALAHVHESGAVHRDLYSKHVLVSSAATQDKWNFTFLDWQRSRILKHVPWQKRIQDLAALDATLAEDLASAPERLAFLHTYMKSCTKLVSGNPPSVKSAALEIRRQASRLLQKRRIQEMRQVSIKPGSQNLIWLDGEAISVTSEFQELYQGRIPQYLQDVYAKAARQSTAKTIPLPSQRSGRLHCQSHNNLWSRLWHFFRRKMQISAEYREAGTIFRLERYRVKAPKLLAVGQRQTSPCTMRSFLLLENAVGTIELQAWWRQNRDNAQHKPLVIQRTAECLRSIHDAGCVLGPNNFLLRWYQNDVEVSIDGVRNMRPRRRMSRHGAIADLQNLLKQHHATTAAEQLRFLFCYLKSNHLNLQAKETARLVMGAKQPKRQVHSVGERHS